MKSLIIVTLVLLACLGAGYLYFDRVIEKQPGVIENLITEIGEKNQQLLAAQILGEKRQAITQLIQNNLIDDIGDPLAEKASIPFLRYLTATMDNLGIRLVELTPLEVVGNDNPASVVKKEYVEVPYELKLIASFKEFGRFLDELEKSPHLISINGFMISSEIDQSSFAEEIVGRPRQHPVNLRISTLAILKASSRGESGKYY